MFAKSKIVKIGDNKSILCKDLTYGYILDIENNIIEDTRHGAIENGTDLTIEEILALRRSEVDALYEAIIKLTYPELYNEDGTLREIKEDDIEDDKKKV